MITCIQIPLRPDYSFVFILWIINEIEQFELRTHDHVMIIDPIKERRWTAELWSCFPDPPFWRQCKRLYEKSWSTLASEVVGFLRVVWFPTGEVDRVSQIVEKFMNYWRNLPLEIFEGEQGEQIRLDIWLIRRSETSLSSQPDTVCLFYNPIQVCARYSPISTTTRLKTLIHATSWCFEWEKLPWRGQHGFTVDEN